MILTSVAAAVAILLCSRLLDGVPSTLDAASALSVDRWVGLVVMASGTVAAAWLGVGGCIALACVVAARLGRTWRGGEALLRRTAPTMIRRLARAAVGVGVGTGLAVAPVTAYAADVDGPTAADPTAVVTTLDLGWQSTGKSTGTASHDAGQDASQDATAGDDTSGGRPTATDVDTATPVARDDGLALEEPSTPTRTPDTRAPHDLVADADHVVVHRGDTLWAIAARTLNEGASDADVLRAVVQWHDTNRDVIGPDSDVIRPGQVLRAPA